MREPFDRINLLTLREIGRKIERDAATFAWKDDLWNWPPRRPEVFGRVTFFRMFASNTQRGFDPKNGPTTPEGIEQERQKWVAAHLRVQDHIARGETPTFERIAGLNEIFGHRIRNRSLHERFRCFDIEDLPEAIQFFDRWYHDLDKLKVWPVQKATLVASYLLAVHPFENGNGRTSRLVLDWILGLHNLPPVSFLNRIQALLSRSPLVWDTPHHIAVKKVLSGLHTTLRLVEGSDVFDEQNIPAKYLA
jgi:hypothetical protein